MLLSELGLSIVLKMAYLAVFSFITCDISLVRIFSSSSLSLSRLSISSSHNRTIERSLSVIQMIRSSLVVFSSCKCSCTVVFHTHKSSALSLCVLRGLISMSFAMAFLFIRASVLSFFIFRLLFNLNPSKQKRFPSKVSG